MNIAKAGERVRHAIAYNLVATIAYAFSQWLMILALGRLGNSTDVGTFSLLMAVVSPIFLLVGLNLRVGLATDARRDFSFHEYLQLQVIVAITSVLVSVFALWLAGFPAARWAVAIPFLIAKGVELFALSFYGYFQRAERSKFVASSMLLRSWLGICLFSVGYVVGGLWLGCFGLMLAWAVSSLIDFRRLSRIAAEEGDERVWGSWNGWRIYALVRRSWALGVSGGINSAAVNIPRYVISGVMGLSALGAFMPSAYLAQIVQTVNGSVGAAVTPRMASVVARGDWPALTRLFWNSTLVTVGASAIAVGFGYLFGDSAIRMLFGSEYSAPGLLGALMVGAACASLYRCPGRVIQAMGFFKVYLAIDLLVLVVALVSALVFIPHWGLEGAAWSIAVSSLVGLLVASILVVIVYRKRAWVTS